MDPEARDGSSVYGLTFDEIEQPLVGDPGADMSMDEFLRNIWTAEESQAMAAALNPSLDGSDGCPSLQKQKQKQESSVKMEEESLGAGGGQQKALQASAVATAGDQQQQRRQCLTLEEVTLEDFLVKAGIVRESPSPCSFQGNRGFPGQAGNDGLVSPVHTPAQHGDHCRLVNSYNEALSQQHQHASHFNTPLSPEGSSNLFTAGILGQPGRKRRTEVPVEKVIQRRQRRMIKNRESAARSRARKQAYTMELEEEVLQLKEENTRLQRKQEEESELGQKQTLAVEEQLKRLISLQPEKSR